MRRWTMFYRRLPLLWIGTAAAWLLSIQAQEPPESNVDAQPFNELAALLLKEDLHDAAKLLRQDWKAFDWLNEGEPPPYHDIGYTSALPPLRVTLGEDEELSLYVEGLMAALPDSKGSAGLPSRRTRLVQLAKRLATYSWKDERLERTVLSYLAEDTTASNHLNKSFQRLGRSLTPSDRQRTATARERSCQQRILRVYQRQSLSEGPRIFHAYLEHALRMNPSEAKREHAKLLLANLEGAFLEDWNRWDPSVFRANLSLLPMAIDLESDHWLSMAYTMSLLADDRASLVLPARIRRAKPRGEMEDPPVTVFLQSVMDHLDAAIGRSHLDGNSLTALAIRLSKNHRFMNHLSHLPELHQNWLTHVKRQAWLSREAIEKRATLFANEAPRKGWAWCETARVFEDAGQPADALACWEEAVKHAGEDPLRYSVFHLGRIQVLIQLKRHQDASKMLRSLNQEWLHPDYKEAFKALERQVRPKSPSRATAV